MALDAKCRSASVDVAVVTQLMTSLDFDRVRRESKPSLSLTVGEATVTVDLGKEYFLDARAAVRQGGSRDLEWVF